MATTKRTKGGRAAAARGRGRAVTKKPAARAKAATSKMAARPKVKAAVRAKAVAKPKTVAKPKAVAAPKRASAKPTAAPKAVAAKAGAERPEVVALKSKFQRERSGLEKRLTEAVREIGMLRHHELRAMQLERQLAERDVTILQLQQQLAAGERRAAEPVVYVHEIQQSLALGMPANDGLVGRGVDEAIEVAALDAFEESQLVDDGALVSDGESELDDDELRSDDFRSDD